MISLVAMLARFLSKASLTASLALDRGLISGCADMATKTHLAKSLRSLPEVLSATHDASASAAGPAKLIAGMTIAERAKEERIALIILRLAGALSVN